MFERRKNYAINKSKCKMYTRMSSYLFGSNSSRRMDRSNSSIGDISNWIIINVRFYYYKGIGSFLDSMPFRKGGNL